MASNERPLSEVRFLTVAEVATVMAEAKDRSGPTVVFINRER